MWDCLVIGYKGSNLMSDLLLLKLHSAHKVFEGLREIVLVFIGGGVGSVLRYALARWIFTSWQSYPWATLVANTFACLLLGMFTGWLVRHAGADTWHKPLLLAGFCGGLSTFSTLIAEIFQLKWALWQSFGYLAVSIAIGLFVFYGGYRCTAG
jgi:CrcB protein